MFVSIVGTMLTYCCYNIFQNASKSKWTGRVAIVTGASAGIGAAICRSMVQLGMVVVGVARRVDRIQVRNL